MAKNALVPLKKWPEQLPLEIAELEMSTGLPLYSEEEICNHFDITISELEGFRKQPKFREEVLSLKKEVSDANSVIRNKSRHLLEHYIDTWIPKMFEDDESSFPEKVKLLMHLSKMARVVDDPAEKAKADMTTAAANVPTLNLILTTAPDSSKTITIEQPNIVSEQ